MTPSIFVTLLPIIISAGALTISGLVYVRRRTVENENHFFNFKLEQYLKIIDSASTTLEIIYRALNDYAYELGQPDKDEEALDEIYDEVEEKMVELRITLHKSCAFIPKNIVEHLDGLYDHIFELQEVIDTDKPTIKGIEQAATKVEDANDKLEDIINLMRADMGIENIDLRLKKRAR